MAFEYPSAHSYLGLFESGHLDMTSRFRAVTFYAIEPPSTAHRPAIPKQT